MLHSLDQHVPFDALAYDLNDLGSDQCRLVQLLVLLVEVAQEAVFVELQAGEGHTQALAHLPVEVPLLDEEALDNLLDVGSGGVLQVPQVFDGEVASEGRVVSSTTAS